jgi:hypothetical protein
MESAQRSHRALTPAHLALIAAMRAGDDLGRSLRL